MVKGSLADCFGAVKRLLGDIPVDFPQTEALLLCERYLCSCYNGQLRGRAALAAHGDKIPSGEETAGLFKAVEQRASRPLQYILGEWEFMGMPLAVGEGVLCPREDSTALVLAALDALENVKTPRILDLCAGTGAIALGICSRREDCTAVCAELSEEAFAYLEKNILRFGEGRVRAVRTDVLNFNTAAAEFDMESFDLICSNPPYIPSADIASLSREVRQEPRIALDGGGDGLRFYRAVCSGWPALLKIGGSLAMELGEGQAEQVREIYVCNNFGNISFKTDMSGRYRAINGTKLNA